MCFFFQYSVLFHKLLKILILTQFLSDSPAAQQSLTGLAA